MYNLKSNIWKTFVYSLTNRRHYITILSIYFLTLPDTTANMIGLYTGIGNLAGFLLEIPSGYFADRFGHKKTMILAKILMLISTFCFIYFQNFYGFVIGSVFFSVSFSFTSGTLDAFLFETLQNLKREKEYSKLMGRLKGNVSFISMFLIILLPFFTEISIILPLIINLFFDIIGLIVSLTLVNPKVQKNIDGELKSILQVFKDSKNLNFLPFVIFVGSITGFIIGEAAFRFVYLESLGYPTIFLGFVLGLSRLVRFIVGRYAYLIENYFTIKQHLFFELFLFSIFYFFVAYLSNPYVIACIFVFVIGYMWGRSPLIQNYIINNYVSDNNYKATVLSIKGQVVLFFQFIVPFFIGYFMNYSYELGYYVLAVALLCILFVSFLFINKN